MNKLKYLPLLVLSFLFVFGDKSFSSSVVESSQSKILITTVYNTNDHDADFTYYGRKVQLAPKTTLKGLNKDAITHLDTGVILSQSLENSNDYKDFLTRGDINVPWGVAGLDGDGYVTAPLRPDSLTVKNGMTVGTDSEKKSYAGNIAESPKLSIFTDQSIDGKNIDPYTPWGDLFQIGGLQANDSKFFGVYGNPYGGGNFGAVDIVTMNGMNSGQRAGISAGDVNSIRSYMNFDAVARYTRTGSTPPRFIVSEAVKDPDGVTHKVTFSATGATFSPALPVYWADMLRKKMHVITNWEGVSDSSIPPKEKNARKPIRTYAGEIENWSTNSKGEVTGITVNGWGIFESKSYGLKDAEAENQIPGITTVDGSKPTLDTDRTNFGKPALMVGVFTKAFDRNTICQINPDDPHGDINNPNGTIGDQVRECEGEELDLWQYNKKDYDSSFHGYTIAMGVQPGASQKLTTDSFGQWISGGNALPTLLRLTNGYWDHGVSIEGDGYQINVPYLVMPEIGNVQLSNVFSQPVKDGNTGIWAWKGYKDKESSGDWSGVSEHLQFKEGGSLTDEAGAVGGQLVFNPTDKISNKPYHYGIGLGAGGSFQFPKYGVIVDEKGQSWFPNGGAVDNGQGLGFIPQSGDDSGHAYITSSNEHTLDLKTSAGGMSDLNSGGITIFDGQGLGFVPESGDDSGHTYITSKDNNMLKIMYSDGKTYGNIDLGLMNSYNGVNIYNGQGLGLIPQTGDDLGHPYISATSPNSIEFKTSAGGMSDLTASIITANNGANILNGQGLGFIPESGDDLGHPYLTSDGTNNGIKLMYSDGKTRGNFSVGELNVNNNVNITHGVLSLYPDSGDDLGHPYISAKNDNTVMFKKSDGSDSNLEFSHFSSYTGGEIYNGQGLGFVPQNGDSQGHSYLAAGDYNYIKLMYSDGKTFSSLKADSVILNSKLGLTVDDNSNYPFFQGLDVSNVNLKNTNGDYSNLILKGNRYVNSEGYVDINSSNGNNINFINSDGGKATLNSGVINSDGGITISNGQGLGLIPSSGDDSGHPYLTATSNSMLNVKTSAGNRGDLTVKNIYADNIYSTGTGSSDLLKDIGNTTLQLTYTDKSSISSLKANNLNITGDVNFKSGSNTDNSFSLIKSTNPESFSFLTSTDGNTSLSNIYYGDGTSNNVFIEPGGKINFNLSDESTVGFNAVDNTNVELHNSLNGWANLSLWTLKPYGGIDIQNGQGLGLIPSSGDDSGHPYLTAISSSDINLNKSSGGLGSLHVERLYENNPDTNKTVGVGGYLTFSGSDDNTWIKVWSVASEPGTLFFNGIRSDGKSGITLKGLWRVISNTQSTYRTDNQPQNLTSATVITLKGSNVDTYGGNTGTQRGSMIYCDNCRSKSFPGASSGIPVWWSGYEWCDALGQTVIVK